METAESELSAEVLISVDIRRKRFNECESSQVVAAIPAPSRVGDTCFIPQGSYLGEVPIAVSAWNYREMPSESELLDEHYLEFLASDKTFLEKMKSRDAKSEKQLTGEAKLTGEDIVTPDFVPCPAQTKISIDDSKQKLDKDGYKSEFDEKNYHSKGFADSRCFDGGDKK